MGVSVSCRSIRSFIYPSEFNLWTIFIITGSMIASHREKKHTQKSMGKMEKTWNTELFQPQLDNHKLEMPWIWFLRPWPGESAEPSCLSFAAASTPAGGGLVETTATHWEWNLGIWIKLQDPCRRCSFLVTFEAKQTWRREHLVEAVSSSAPALKTPAASPAAKSDQVPWFQGVFLALGSKFVLHWGFGKNWMIYKYSWDGSPWFTMVHLYFQIGSQVWPWEAKVETASRWTGQVEHGNLWISASKPGWCLFLQVPRWTPFLWNIMKLQTPEKSRHIYHLICCWSRLSQAAVAEKCELLESCEAETAEQQLEMDFSWRNFQSLPSSPIVPSAFSPNFRFWGSSCRAAANHWEGWMDLAIFMILRYFKSPKRKKCCFVQIIQTKCSAYVDWGKCCPIKAAEFPQSDQASPPIPVLETPPQSAGKAIRKEFHL